MQSRKTFEDLGTFTLARGLREVKRAQLAKEASKQANPNSKGKASVDEVEMADAGTEKARLLENEGASPGDDPTERQRDDSSAHASPREDGLAQPLTSPNTEPSYPVVDSPISEKARGKMRARRSLSVDTISSLDRASLGIGKNGFVPTQEWVLIFSFFIQYFCLRLCSGDLLATRVRSLQLVKILSTNDTYIGCLWILSCSSFLISFRRWKICKDITPFPHRRFSNFYPILTSVMYCHRQHLIQHEDLWYVSYVDF